eukprot:13324616-Alexandrium_andersonii.AAC.1
MVESLDGRAEAACAPGPSAGRPEKKLWRTKRASEGQGRCRQLRLTDQQRQHRCWPKFGPATQSWLLAGGICCCAPAASAHLRR